MLKFTKPETILLELGTKLIELVTKQIEVATSEVRIFPPRPKDLGVIKS